MSCDLVRGRCLIAFVLAGVLTTASAAAATGESRAAARQHWNQAQELKKHGKLAEACQHLEEVERLDPKLPTLMELAECTERLGNWVQAQKQWSAARDRAKHDEKPQSRARAEARLEAVQKRIAHLTLQLDGSASGAQVLCDDAPLDPSSLAGALPMNPGDHVIVVKLQGHDDAKYPVKLADGGQQTLAITAGPLTAADRPPVAALPPATGTISPGPVPPLDVTESAAPAPVTPAKSWWSTEHTAGVALGALGLAAIGGGSALCIAARGGSEPHSGSADQRFALGGISIASGGVLLLSGIVLLASGSSDDATQHARLTVSPGLLIAGHAAEISAAGEF